RRIPSVDTLFLETVYSNHAVHLLVPSGPSGSSSAAPCSGGGRVWRAPVSRARFTTLSAREADAVASSTIPAGRWSSHVALGRRAFRGPGADPDPGRFQELHRTVGARRAYPAGAGRARPARGKQAEPWRHRRGAPGP